MSKWLVFLYGVAAGVCIAVIRVGGWDAFWRGFVQHPDDRQAAWERKGEWNQAVSLEVAEWEAHFLNDLRDDKPDPKPKRLPKHVKGVTLRQ